MSSLCQVRAGSLVEFGGHCLELMHLTFRNKYHRRLREVIKVKAGWVVGFGAA